MLKIGQKVVIKENAKALTQKYLDWTPEMNALVYRIGEITNLDNLGKFASVKIDNRIYHFTTDSLLPHVVSTYKLRELYNKYKEQLQILSAWYDAKIKGKADRILLKYDNPFEEERDRLAWEEGWKEQDEHMQAELQFLVAEHLFREGKLTHQLLTLISEKRWDAYLNATSEAESIISSKVRIETGVDDSL